MEQFDLQPRVKLDKSQRVGVGLLVVITVGVVFVTIFQFNSNIFSYGKRGAVDPLASLDTATRVSAEQEALKQIDTDGDGLKDFDELFVYHSSPYMRDTDSDGIPDGEEVRKGTSPTCPAGKDCLFNPIAASANASSTARGSIGAGGDAAQPPAPSVNSAPNGSLTPTQAAAMGGAQAQNAPAIDPGQITPDVLREVLKENGFTPEQLQSVSDEDLMKLVQEAQKQKP